MAADVSVVDIVASGVARCKSTAIACSARSMKPRTSFRKRSCAPGADSAASKGAPRSTGSHQRLSERRRQSLPGLPADHTPTKGPATEIACHETDLDTHDNTESCISVKKKSQVRSPHGLTGCPPKPPLIERPLLEIETAAELARVYETLANDTRLRLLHVLLKEGEIYPSGLAANLGMKPQAVGDQLPRLAIELRTGPIR